MRINNNMSAVVTNNQLLGTEQSLSDVIEKLSSGLSINHASDNPSGIAIAGKMQAQIDGLDQASTNGSDGISVLQTAEGALQEVTSMIQRMRELSVQAANGTNAQSEKETIQQEIDSLLEEIDRISETTEFNTITLLDGSLDNRTYADNCTRIQTSNSVAAGMYALTITSAAVQAKVTGSTTQNIVDYIDAQGGLTTSGTITINDYSFTLTKGMTGEEVYEALRDGAEIGGATITDPTVEDKFEITSVKYGAEGKLRVGFSSAALAKALGIDYNGETSFSEVGTDVKVTLHKKGDVDPATGEEYDTQFGKQATVAYDGNKITVSDVNGFELSFLADADYVGDINFNVTDIGSMTLHIGANKNQEMEIRIGSTSCEYMYIDDLDVTVTNGAEDAMDKLDEALEYVTSIRSQLGAYENRLEHTTSSLDATEENMTSAISRIEDADMATTMVEYTKLNVLAQAGTSALAQANELPQLALQLLQ